MFSLFKKKPLFTQAENQAIIEAIRFAERRTSGEVRVYIEAKNAYMSPLDRAAELFFSLRMEETEHRNAVLVYIAVKHKEFALFADKGIYEGAGTEFWNAEAAKMISKFSEAGLVEGICQCVKDIGEVLNSSFPYEANEDKNELPDEIVFGKI